MDENTENALSEVGKQTVSEIGQGLGWLFKNRPKRIAVDNYISDVRNSNLNPEEKAVLTYYAKEIIKGNDNLSDIVNIARINLINSSEAVKSAQAIDQDWQNLFIQNAKLVSDDEFKKIWGKVLATECNENGSITKSLIITLQRMDKEDAYDFVNIANLAIASNGEYQPIISFRDFDNYKKYGITLESCSRLEQLGLIRTDFTPMSNGYAIMKSCDKEVDVKYFSHSLVLPEKLSEVSVGNVLFTKDGSSLFKAVEKREAEGFWNDFVRPWFNDHVVAWEKDQNIGD